MTAYTPEDFGLQKNGPQFAWLDQRLTVHGFPPLRLLDPPKDRVQRWQLAQGWKGTGADGLVGPKTIVGLSADPKPPTPPPAAKLPAQVIDLSRAKLTTPFGKEDQPTEVKQPGLNRYADSRCFFVRDDSVVFRVTGDGVTTSGSSFPRCELREMEPNGDKAGWGTAGSTERRLLEGLYLVKGNAKVVIAQIHDALDDVVMVSWENGRIVVEWSKGKGQGSEAEEVDVVGVDEWFHLAIVAGDGVIKVLLNGEEVGKRKMVRSGCYQKAGAYLQSTKPTAWAEVAIKGDSLEMGVAA